MTDDFWKGFFESRPLLSRCRADILAAFEATEGSLRSGGMLFICGNGGSSCDADHIVGELMKRFRLDRPLSAETVGALRELPDAVRNALEKLEAPLRAMALGKQSALVSAFANDVDPSLEFAQELLGYGRPGDVLLGLSTSGNSRNVVAAAHLARALHITTIGMTGRAGGELATIADTCIQVPADETAAVQELHLPIYHALCAALELSSFGP